MMSRREILVIDDEVEYCRVMKLFFEDHGYDVSFAYTKKEALVKMRTRRAYCIIASTVIVGVYQDDLLSQVPVDKHPHFFITVYPVNDKQSRMTPQALAGLRLVKPFSMGDLLTMITASGDFNDA